MNCSKVNKSCLSKIWLNAGITHVSDNTRKSQNLIGGVNQQERPERESSENTRRILNNIQERYVPVCMATCRSILIKRNAHNSSFGAKISSEVPCQVSSGPHE